MFLESFKVSGSSVGQIFILGAIGYFLMRKNMLGEEGLNILSRLTIELILPVLIFCQLIKGFSFSAYPDWWIFPLLSVAVNILGIAIGVLFIGFIKGKQHKMQFLSLTGFQNSGYLPIALVGSLMPAEKLGAALIYLFLFMLGFNITTFSLGVYMLEYPKERKFDIKDLFSPPVTATLITLVLVFFGLNRFVPDFIYRPLKLFGDCTIPLAMLVVGGNIAQIHLGHIDKKAMCFLILAKLLILPVLGVLFLLKFKIPDTIAMLILIQLAVPSATSLSVIIRHYKREDLLISQGIFFTHLASVITLPLFLSLYFSRNMIK